MKVVTFHVVLKIKYGMWHWGMTVWASNVCYIPYVRICEKFRLCCEWALNNESALLAFSGLQTSIHNGKVKCLRCEYFPITLTGINSISRTWGVDEDRTFKFMYNIILIWKNGIYIIIAGTHTHTHTKRNDDVSKLMEIDYRLVHSRAKNILIHANQIARRQL